MIWTTPGFDDFALRLLPSSSYCPLSLRRICVGVHSLHCRAALSSRATVEPSHSFRRSIFNKIFPPRLSNLHHPQLSHSCMHDLRSESRSGWGSISSDGKSIWGPNWVQIRSGELRHASINVRSIAMCGCFQYLVCLQSKLSYEVDLTSMRTNTMSYHTEHTSYTQK